MNAIPRPERTPTPEIRAQHELDNFIDNPGLTKFANLFGVEELPGDTAEKLEVLQKIATDHWDFRKGAERQDVDWSNELLDQEDSEQWSTIFEAATDLGLVQDTEPSIKRPDSLIILGGANKAPFYRLRYGLENVDDFGQVVYLGSSRKISVAEKEKSSVYAPGAHTEFDLGCGAFEALLNAKVVDEYSEVREGDIWGMRLYEFQYDGTTKHGFVLSTPQQIGSRRATTYDNYKFFADRAELSRDSAHSVVAVTTGFYTAAQHMPGVQELTVKYGTALETIGHSAEYGGGKRKPSQLLQETKAAIDAAVRLQQSIARMDSHIKVA